MKLLFIVYGSIRTLSGGYLYDRMLVAALEARGHRVRVVSQKNRGCYAANIWGNLDPGLIREARHFAPDIVLEDELNHPSLFWLNRRLRAELGVPIVGLVHHLRQVERHGLPGAVLARWLERLFLAQLDGYLCNSEFTRRSVLIALGKEPGSVLPRPFAIALPGKDRLASIGEPEPSVPAVPPVEAPPESAPELRVLFLGNVIPRKGVHVLLSALGRQANSRAGAPAWRLAIAGNQEADPGYTRRLKRTIRRLDLADRVVWLGTVPDPALPALFAAHDLLVVPSQCEGYGIVYAEAMSYGLPVVAGSYGGAAEMIIPGKNGYLLDWEDAAGLAGLLAQLAADPALLAEMKKAARKRAADLAGWNESMAGAADFLEAISRRG